MIKRINCSVCEKKVINNFYTLDDIPIKLYCSDEFINKSEKLSFVICDYCNTIQLSELVPLDILYSNSHNFISAGKIWYNYFQLFSQKIENIIINKNILEIGCPSGKIAQQTNNYNKWFIIDPNKNKNIKFKENIYFIQHLFDKNFNIKDKIDIIIHSHLFEHIYEPNIFLKKCYNLLEENGEMFFGVPNMEYIAKEELSPFLGLFFEHTIFLNKINITYLLEKNNFKIKEIIDYENHSTLYHVIKKKKNNNLLPMANKFDHNKIFIPLFKETLERYLLFIEKCKKRIEENNNHKIYIFGASYNTQYLLSFGLKNSKIDGILDNCEEKQHKYFYGYQLKILNPEVLINNDCIVILKNGYYSQEISEQIKNLNKNTIIIE